MVLQMGSKSFSPIFLSIHCQLVIGRRILLILYIKRMGDIHVSITDYSVFITIIATVSILNLRSPTAH
jgi:hypothetical protein